jgi:hypothetical protein
MTESSKTLIDALQGLKGRVLSSVEFVSDYIQLRFDGATLTAYTPALLVLGGKQIARDDPGYRDSLCAQIGVRVTDAHLIEGKELALLFENGTIIKIPLEEKDYRGPEALMFQSEDGSFWVI